MSIKEEVELLFNKIKEAKNRIEELRTKCKHKDTYETLYSHRIGHAEEAIMCSDCQKVIKYK